MSDSREKTIFVTGGAGFIATNFVRYLRMERPARRVVDYDALTYAGNPASLEDLAGDPHYSFIHGDVRDRPA